MDIRLDDERQCLLVVIGALADGRKQLLAVHDGFRESELSWKELLEDLKRRGLKLPPKLAVGDGGLGFWAALRKVYPATREQRCWVHRTVNVLDKLPKSMHGKAKQALHDIYLAESRQAAEQGLDRFAALYQAKFPKAVECLSKDREALLAFYDFPAVHWGHLRTTNPTESTFATVRLRQRRTKGCGSEVHLRNRLKQRRRVRRNAGVVELGTLKPAAVHQEFRVLRRIFSVAVKKKLCPTNPCAGVEFPVILKSLFRPHYMTWSEQQKIELHAPVYLRNVIQIVTETDLSVYKELACTRKDQVDLANKLIFVEDSKTPAGVAEVPLTDIAVEAFRSQIAVAGPGQWLFPNPKSPTGYQQSFKKTRETSLRRAGVPYFRLYDLRSTHATRLSAGGVADEWVTQLLRQTDAKVFKKYSQMKLQMKRDALARLNRKANEPEPQPSFDTVPKP